MAGDWIKMRNNLWDDPRISALCDHTGATESAVIGGLYWLWSTADEHSETGVLPGLSKKAIDRKTGISGFGDALVSIDWLVENADGVEIARFGEHNGSSAKQRAQTAKRVAKHTANASLMPESKNTNDVSVSEALVESNTCISVALAREEKRREDIKPTTSDEVVVGNYVADNCPHQEIIAAYHELVPVGTHVRIWNGTRAKHLQARWRENLKRQNLEWWKRFFEYVSKSEFLTGRAHAAPGRDPFVVSLDWLVNPQNFAKVIEGKYHSERSA